MPPAKRHPAWVFTINNYTEDDVKAVENVECQAITCGYEVGENGTPHIQGAIYWGSKNGKTCGATCKALGGRARVEPMRGSWEENLEYTTKEGNALRVEGEGPQQGARNDLIGMKRKLDEGATLADLYEYDFGCAAKYSRAFKEYIDLKQRSQMRTEQTTCDWIFGPTGAGKSHIAFNSVDLSDTYIWKNDGGWWDGYEGQTYVIINEYRGEIPYGELLSMLDKWPHSVRRRCREPAPFVSKHVVITSSMHPRKVYWKLNAKDSIDQLMRRVKVIECYFPGFICFHGIP